jgi:hypothetical protein
LVNWSIGKLVNWSIGKLVNWSIGKLVNWSIGKLVNWSVGGLVLDQAGLPRLIPRFIITEVVTTQPSLRGASFATKQSLPLIAVFADSR